jgi:biopolymer transport protein TolQ
MILPFNLIIGAAGPYYAFENSDFVGRAVVIFLFFGSIFTWTIMVEKGMALVRAKRHSLQFGKLFRNAGSLTGLLSEARRNPGPVAKVYMAGAERLLEFYGMSTDQPSLLQSAKARSTSLTTAQMEALRTVMEREVSDQILILEEKIGFLATAVSVSPFLGLFGTVWGVMMAFVGIASQGRADISALAPGVSGALLTTVVALMVAIPSLIGYNLLTSTIRKVTIYMDNFTEEFLARIRLEQLDIEPDEDDFR